MEAWDPNRATRTRPIDENLAMPRRHVSQSSAFSELIEAPLGITSRALARQELTNLRRWANETSGLHARVPSTIKRTIEENLDRCFPDQDKTERARTIVDTFRHMHYLAAEIGICWHYSAERASALIERYEGLDALAGTDPLIVLQPHFGNWELLPLAIRTRRTVTALYSPAKILAIDENFLRARTGWGTAVHPTTTQGLRQLRRALGDGSAVLFLPDQVPPPNAGIEAPFFENPARTMTFVHQLIRRSRARVVFGWIERTSHAFAAYFRPARDAIYADDVLASAAAMNADIESIVRRDPAQYQWGYKRFKSPRDKRSDSRTR